MTPYKHKKGIQKLPEQLSLKLLVVAAIFLLSLFIFSFIVYEAVYEKEDVFDITVIQFFAAHSSPAFIEAMKRVTFFGSDTFLFPVYIILIAWYAFKRKTQYAIDIAIIGISSTVMLHALKVFFHRHRPSFPVIKNVTGYSFPSGHALSSLILSSIFMYLVYKGNLSSLQKAVLIVLLLSAALLIGISRVALNVHYATDVIAGFCLAIIWVIISFAVLKKLRKNNAPPEGAPVS